MKKHVLVMSFMVAAVVGNASAASWIATSIEDWSFDSSTVETLPNGLFRVWNRYVLIPEVVMNLDIKLREGGSPKDFSEYAKSIALWEINCSKRLFRPIQGTDYSLKGVQINSYDVEKTQLLERAVPDSSGAIVLEEFCKFISKKKSKGK